MTVIAYKDGILAADSQIGGEYTLRGYRRKVHRSPRGTIGAACGSAGVCADFDRWVCSGRIDEWIDGGFTDPLPVKSDDGFGAIIVTPTARIVCVDREGRPVEFHAPFMADGSGRELAFGAMAAGATAAEAVRIAIQFDAGCGGEVHIETLQAPS